jgi:hypothetical protein
MKVRTNKFINKYDDLKIDRDKLIANLYILHLFFKKEANYELELR